MTNTALRRFGVDVHVSDEGEGVPVLLINGLAASADGWAPLRAQLPRHRTIAFDSPGSGRTPPTRRPVGVRGLAGLAAEVLDHAQLATAHVVGYSFGGAIAQELAHRHQHRVRSLTLLCTSFAGMATDPRFTAGLLDARRLRDPIAYARAAPRLLGGRVRSDADFRDRYVRHRVAAEPSLLGYASQLVAAAAWTSLPWLHTIRAPTLVIAATDDPIVPQWVSAVLTARVRDGRRALLRGGHLLPLERPADVAELIDRFVT